MLKFGTVVPIVEAELKEFMRIEQNIFAAKSENVRKLNQVTEPIAGQSLVSFDESERLKQTLGEAPDVRADKIARGKALIADPNYPSKEQVQAIATTLAGNWSRSTALTNNSASGVRDAAIVTAVG